MIADNPGRAWLILQFTSNPKIPPAPAPLLGNSKPRMGFWRCFAIAGEIRVALGSKKTEMPAPPRLQNVLEYWVHIARRIEMCFLIQLAGSQVVALGIDRHPQGAAGLKPGQ